MSSDPLLKAAIAHWGPRFVANGVVLTDFEEVTGSLDVATTTGAGPGRRAPRITSSLAAKRWRRSISSPPANACSAPASITISPRFCSCTTRRR